MVIVLKRTSVRIMSHALRALDELADPRRLWEARRYRSSSIGRYQGCTKNSEKIFGAVS